MDAQTINRTTNIVGLVGSLKQSGRYYIGPCPFCGGRDRFNVKQADDGQLWFCRQCGDGRYHDAVAFLMKRDGLTFPQLLAAYGGGQPGAVAMARRPSSPPLARPLPALARPPGEGWQVAALTTAAQAAEYLHSDRPGAAAAWRYLRHERGLTADTIRRAGLGFNPDWRDVPGVGRLAPGVVIPAMVAGQLWYLQVRTTEAARRAAEKSGRKLDKYHALAGSKLAALFGANTLPRAHTAVVTEGEFDALLLAQFLPDGVTAVTMGSAGSLPNNPAWLRYFAAVKRVYLVMDNDAAGQAAVARWRDLLPWVELLPVPGEHNDITDYWRAGGDVGAWVKAAVLEGEYVESA